ncbi:tRNA (N(6)-L-threonylcarbamoyladenosine(37)-C(2))-methylthiotransferase MtaB [Bartonella sp. B35(2025)]
MAIEIITFGCRLNSYESEIIRKESASSGLDQLKDDSIIFNTCAVTAEAVRQAKQAIRKAKRKNPRARIIVTGCAAQIEAKNFALMKEVDLVLGNEEKLHAHSYRQFPDFGINHDEKLRINNIMEVQKIAPHMVDAMEERTRAFVQVQNGCDHRCTFCIIPYGRGPSRSVPMGAVIEQIKRLTSNGIQEVVLTGVDLTSYGHDLPGKATLGKLTSTILHHVPDLSRLRLSSIDSIEADQELIDLLAYEKRIMPYLHLSLQAGDNMILKRMKRRHLREHAIQFCQDLRAKRPTMIYGADLIAGFPTETEEMFQNSLALINDCNLTHLHVFPFSPREGTPAARMPQINRKIIKMRAEKLRQVGEEAYQKHLSHLQNSQQTILVEKDEIGRTEDYTLAQIKGAKAGTIVQALIIDHDGHKLIAVPLN